MQVSVPALSLSLGLEVPHQQLVLADLCICAISRYLVLWSYLPMQLLVDRRYRVCIA